MGLHGDINRCSQYSWLQKLVTAELKPFHVLRGGEPVKLTINDYNNANCWKKEEDMDKLQDETDKLLAKRLKVVYVSGKRKRRVPILFTEEVVGGIGI